MFRKFIIFVLFVGLIAMSYFLMSEMLVKFSVGKEFVDNAATVVTYSYPGSKGAKIDSGMKNLRLEAERPFCALVGFNLVIFAYEGYDHFATVCSDEDGVAHAEMYFGKGAVEFIFIIDREDLQIDFTLDGEEKPIWGDTNYIIVEPHWWQKLGIYS